MEFGPILSNKLILAGIAVEILLVLPFAGAMILIEELRKWIFRRFLVSSD